MTCIAPAANTHTPTPVTPRCRLWNQADQDTPIWDAEDDEILAARKRHLAQRESAAADIQ